MYAGVQYALSIVDLFKIKGKITFRLKKIRSTYLNA